MNRTTWNHLLLTLGVALAVAGVAYGMALGWDASDGPHALWVATVAAVVSAVLGLLAAGAVRDAGKRPPGAPSAFRVGYLGFLVMLVLACFPAVILHMAPLVPYFTWLLVHAAAQSVLQWTVLRRADADERRRGTPQAG